MNAIFTYSVWAASFPELALWTNATQAQMYWQGATMLLDNTECSPVKCIDQRTALLNLLTAHLCALQQSLGGQPSSPLVGRITDATEGSVTVKAEMVSKTESAAFFNQTKYGTIYWQMVLPFRMARYAPGPRRAFNPLGVPGYWGSFR